MKKLMLMVVVTGVVLVQGCVDEEEPRQPLISGVHVQEYVAQTQEHIQVEVGAGETDFCNVCDYELDSELVTHTGCQTQPIEREHCSDCGYYIGSQSCCKTNKYRVDRPLPVSPPVWGSISSEKLSREYEENEIRADSKYGGGLYRIYGSVQSIGIGIFGGYYVALEGDGWLSGVHCDFTTSSYALENLKKDEYCTIRGTIDRGGTTILSVTVSDCEIVD